MKNLIQITAIACILTSCKTMKIVENTYPFESFEKDSLPQSVKLSNYNNPNNRPQQDEEKLVILCASGGGSRAASFSIGIMLELERVLLSTDSSKNILNEIDYFSTVSGGGWGVSSFIAHKYQLEKYNSEPFKSAIIKYNKTIGANTPIYIPATFNASELYLLNICNFKYFSKQVRLIPSMGFGAGLSDRRMVQSLNNGYLGWLNRRNIERKLWNFTAIHSKPFDDDSVAPILLSDVFRSPKSSKKTVMQIANTTNIDNYSLIPFTPDRLKSWGIIDYNHHEYKVRSLPNTNSVSDYDSIPFAIGIKSSSGIPFAVNASSFKTKNKTNQKNYFVHIQDGGIVDQQAIHSAKAILSQHQSIKDAKNRIVIVIDASSSGLDIQNSATRRKAGRTHNLYRVVAPFTSPDAQYSLTRERIKLLEKEYNCTVIYLGVDLLMDSSLSYVKKTTGLVGRRTRKKVTTYFCNRYYNEVQKEPDGFLAFGMQDRQLLYSYINQYMKTAFNSKGDRFDGTHQKDKPESTATMMILSGRGVVQLKKNEIKRVFH